MLRYIPPRFLYLPHPSVNKQQLAHKTTPEAIALTRQNVHIDQILRTAIKEVRHSTVICHCPAS